MNKIQPSHLLYLCAGFGVTATVLLLQTPSEAESAIILGFSINRILIAFTATILSAIFAYLGYAFQRSYLFSHKIKTTFQQALLTPSRLWSLLIVVTGWVFITLAALYIYLSGFVDLPAPILSTISRVWPLMVWSLIVVSSFIFIIFRNLKTPQGMPDNPQTIRSGLMVQPERWLKPVILTVAIFLLSFFIYFLIWSDIDSFTIAIDHCDILFCDFTQHYYKQASQIGWSDSPVPGYFYSAFFAVLLSPIRFFPLESASRIWGVLQVVMAITLFFIPATNIYKKSRVFYYLYVVFFAFSYPIIHNLKWGQVSVLMALSSLGAMALYPRHRTLSAFLLAFGVAIKYYTIIFLIYFIFIRDIKFVLKFLAAFLLFFLAIPFLVLGIAKTWSFNIQTLTNSMAPFSAASSQSFELVISRLLDQVSRLIFDSQIMDGGVRNILAGFGGLVFLIGIMFLYFKIKRQHISDPLYAGALIFTLIPFAISTSWPHYFVYLPFVQVYTGIQMFERGSPAFQYALWLLAGFLSSMFMFFLAGDYYKYQVIGPLFFSNLILAYLLWPSINNPKQQR